MATSSEKKPDSNVLTLNLLFIVSIADLLCLCKHFKDKHRADPNKTNDKLCHRLFNSDVTANRFVTSTHVA